MIRFVSCITLLLLCLSSFSAAQNSSGAVGEVSSFTRIIPGVLRPDGRTTPPSFVRGRYDRVLMITEPGR